MDVWVTDNSSTKRRGQYIAYAATRAADGPDGMEARGRHSPAGGKGLTLSGRATSTLVEVRAHSVRPIGHLNAATSG